MHQAIIGVFDTYGDASAVVRDLEVSGIVGEQVEVIKDADLDARTNRWVRGSSGDVLEKRIEKDLRHLLHRPEKQDVRASSGEQPDYIGRQEFYASHVHSGPAVVIVRGDDSTAEVAKAILQRHGAKAPSGKGGPAVLREDDSPAAEPLEAMTHLLRRPKVGPSVCLGQTL
jgi:hypothetical protein